MRQVLVPIDAHHGAQVQRALAEAIRLHRQEAAGVVLLSVQAPVSPQVARHFAPDELERLQRTGGREELAPARAVLDAAGVRHRAIVRIGRRAETIAATARELGCDRIAFGPEPDAGLRWFGSVAQQVAHLLQVQDVARFVRLV